MIARSRHYLGIIFEISIRVIQLRFLPSFRRMRGFVVSNRKNRKVAEGFDSGVAAKWLNASEHRRVCRANWLRRAAKHVFLDVET